jgi:ABC-type oligopeptide transport system substrate-binding subunit
MMAVLYVNTLMPSLADAQLRRDLRATLNTDTLIKNHYFGYAEKAFQGIHKRDSYFVQEPPVRYALSGVKREKIPSITLLAPEEPRPYLPAPLETAKEICQQLAPMVSECNIKQLPIQRLARKKASEKDYELILLGDTTYDNQLLSKDILCPGVSSESSRTGICVEPLNSLAKTSLSSDLPEDELKQKLLNAFREQSVMLPLWYAPKLVFYSKLKVNVVDQTELFQTWLHSP